KMKNRPALILREMPSYGDLLVCGISKQLNHYIKDFDEIISPDHEDYKSSGLLSKSLIRLGFLAVLPRKRILGTIGRISNERHKRLLNFLSNYLTSEM
ncbi:MAG: type II toxin-antitoxin system PemK/MazF family toxin, partial [Planctomycetes bacterium]|nr:type II toxin-antitoxin system PemK/MazF family toxin [Planctomycetota bacterium]